MKPLTAADPETKSPDFAADNLAKLRALFPELVTEGPGGVAVNLDVIKQLVGDQTVNSAKVVGIRSDEPAELDEHAGADADGKGCRVEGGGWRDTKVILAVPNELLRESRPEGRGRRMGSAQNACGQVADHAVRGIEHRHLHIRCRGDGERNVRPIRLARYCGLPHERDIRKPVSRE